MHSCRALLGMLILIKKYMYLFISSYSMWSDFLMEVNNLQGEALFQTHENLEHLAMMERVLGPMPQHMLKRVE